MVLSELGSPLGVDSNEFVLKKDRKLWNILVSADPVNLDISRQNDVVLFWSRKLLEFIIVVERRVLGLVIFDWCDLQHNILSNKAFKLVSQKNSFRFLKFIFMGKVFGQVAEHLFEAGKKIFDSVQSQKVLLVLILVKISTQEESHTVFHDSFLDLWKIICVEIEIFDKLSSFFAVIVGAESTNQIFLKISFPIDKKLCSFELVQVDELKHQVLEIKMLLELVSDDHQGGVIESSSCHLFFCAVY